MQDQLLQTLRELAPGGEPVALTRLAKRLDERVSVLLRELTALSDASLGGVPGPGLVQLACDDGGRWTVRLAVVRPPSPG
ncbi:hypothetical protein [Roseateles puraquae]|uniref:Uncharacterized protein n=1 Tax=Roseateles puraquae TaxID=431059 RepID=A0A254NIH1_9BURK|nr:hypothetical protein [Roseateles puraquae]MDG0853871.1 hypothetical protein [Roseateles puraquae]OWR04703.1 hypothetical protein CDO81_09000 [Roseateles puraquae]